MYIHYVVFCLFDCYTSKDCAFMNVQVFSGVTVISSKINKYPMMYVGISRISLPSQPMSTIVRGKHKRFV